MHRMLSAAIVLAGLTTTTGALGQERETKPTSLESNATQGAERSALQKLLVGIGFGGGGITGNHDEDYSQGASLTFQLGYRLSEKLHLQLTTDGTTFARYQANADYYQQQSVTSFGLRWTPFDRTANGISKMFDPGNLHLRAGVGVGHLRQLPYGSLTSFDSDRSQWGLGATAGIGWMLARIDRVGVGIEVSDSAAWYGDGIRHNFGFNLLVEIGAL